MKTCRLCEEEIKGHPALHKCKNKGVEGRK